MSFKQLMRERKQLEDMLRQHGIEAEDAFYLLAFRYLQEFSNKIQSMPERILEKGERVYKKIQNDARLTTFVTSLILFDSYGENLPIWYQYFLGRRFRESSGKFFTPRPIAHAMAALIPRKEGAVIMDPTCGGGTFLLEAARRWGSLRCHLIGNDVDDSLVDLAQLVLGLGDRQHHKKTFLATNIFEPNAQFREWYGRVDFILANPPFSLAIDNIQVESRLFELGYRNSDALFLDVCLRLLRTQGRLVCLLPHSIVANPEFQGLRLAVEESSNLLGVIGMPEGVFHLTASTTTRADIVILEKDDTKQSTRPPVAVFAFAPTVGVPLNRRRVEHQENFLERVVSAPDVLRSLGIE